MPKISRLWTRLGLTEPLIRVWSEEDSSLNMNDHDISSITISRGGANEAFGTQEHTLEVSVVGPRYSRPGLPLHCDLTASGARRVATLTGALGSQMTPRYFGRIGRQSREDHGTGQPNQWTTTLFCSKWQSQLEKSDRLGNQISGQQVTYLFQHFMRPEYSGFKYLPLAEIPATPSDYGTMINEYDLGEAKIPYSEFSTKYFDDPGYYVQNTRAGADRVLTIKYRWDDALARLKTWLPITRSQVLTPASLDQPNEDMPNNHEVTWRTATGVRSWISGPDVNDVRIPVTKHDLTHIQFDNEYQPIQKSRAAYGAQRSDIGYRLPTVTIDLLRLIDSPNEAHRIQAGQLLLLEMGDPVFISGDWHADTRGIHFATGIKETITADTWEIELSLSPSIAIVGEWTPEVLPQTWDSAQSPWNDESRKWNDAKEYS